MFSKGTSRQFYFQWHFLSKCNLRCKHCYQDNYIYDEMDYEKALIVADKICLALEKWNMYGRISMTGGEPFVSKHLFDILYYLDNKDRITSLDCFCPHPRLKVDKNTSCLAKNQNTFYFLILLALFSLRRLWKKARITPAHSSSRTPLLTSAQWFKLGLVMMLKMDSAPPALTSGQP